ncbi:MULTISPECIES: type II toxin-antitoxin system VapC family toxin [unclassified Halanaerobium]|uniref:type II toxin-antitoxin system VapC family toxin n=1 Tax=unclassified Halanaerobium TaxID=2641197 RepID=UPI000DF16FAC|nr:MULTISPECIES: type II toxin-antitoxin system VapC family toxin [unclassified Halanaerobium]RCW41371.1 hypothetical protein DFR78_13412 [Halanaerobium sp. MA284_MarDTE_T2]RCW86952.1 hypothetical protein DER71_10660 [Halanaerobium sp. DL-01]
MYLLDTNILIYYFNNNIPEYSFEDITNILKNDFNISIITKMEFLGFPRHTPVSFKKSQEFLLNSSIYNINDKIADKTISLRREYKIKLPDAIIAATALGNGFTLVTRNENDFINIKNIKLYNPFK